MRIAKFVIVGGSGVIVNEGLLWFFTEIIGLYYLFSSAIGIEVSIITNFLLNNYWTFKDKAKEQRLVKKGIKYNTVSVGSLLINMTVLFLLVTYLQIYYLFANMVGIVLAFLWNYFLNLKWTFR